MRLAGHLLLLAALALLGIKAAFDDHESSGLLAGLGVFPYGLLYATYLGIHAAAILSPDNKKARGC